MNEPSYMRCDYGQSLSESAWADIHEVGLADSAALAAVDGEEHARHHHGQTVETLAFSSFHGQTNYHWLDRSDQ